MLEPGLVHPPSVPSLNSGLTFFFFKESGQCNFSLQPPVPSTPTQILTFLHVHKEHLLITLSATLPKNTLKPPSSVPTSRLSNPPGSLRTYPLKSTTVPRRGLFPKTPLTLSTCGIYSVPSPTGMLFSSRHTKLVFPEVGSKLSR